MLGSILILLCAVSIWGYAFIAVKLTLVYFDPIWSHCLRYIIAAVMALPVLLYKKTFTKKMALHKLAFGGGALLFVGNLTQNIGLGLTTAAKSAFITCLYVFFVPLVHMIFEKTKLSFIYLFLVVLSLIGLAMLCELKLEGFNSGDAWTVLCSLLFTSQIYYIEKNAKDMPDIFEMNFLQCFYAGILGIFIGPILGTKFSFEAFSDAKIIESFFILSFLSSLMAFTAQLLVQKKLKSYIVAPIYLLESPVAVICGYYILGEKLSTISILGGILLITSVGLVPFFGTEKYNKN